MSCIDNCKQLNTIVQFDIIRPEYNTVRNDYVKNNTC